MKSLKRIVDGHLRRNLGTLLSVRTTEPVAALTFDDGPHPDFTPQVLEILGRHGIRATFFMVGAAAERHPEIVRKVQADGHAIGGHSWDHRSFTSLSGRERRRQMRACEWMLAPVGTRLFRYPYGKQDLASRLDAFWRRYEVVGWSVDPADWKQLDPERIAERVIQQLHPGSVVLFHDALFDQMNLPSDTMPSACVNRAPMLLALEIVLARVQRQYRFVTVPDLIRCGAPNRAYRWFSSLPPPLRGGKSR